MSAKRTSICEFTSLPSDQCAHCSGPPPRLSPHYQLVPTSYQGWPCVEILKDGGPVHPYDSHFTFGTQKAWLLIHALSVIEEFARYTDDEGTTTVTSQMLRCNVNALTIETWIEMHEEFVRSTGERIIRPWLHLKKLPDGPHIGIGVQKAKAICALENQLRTWVENA